MDFFRPRIEGTETARVTRALALGQLSSGAVVDEFEAKFMSAFGYSGFGVPVSSGTSGLYLALLAYGIGPGDEVITTPYTFVATVNSIIMTGATPVFCDIETTGYGLDPSLLPDLITSRTKAVIPVDVFGVPCDLKGIRTAIEGTDIVVIQDSVEALGAKYQGVPVGSGADAAVFGFYPNKQLTTAEGGMVITNSSRIASEVRALANHGYNREHGVYTRAGLNMRMSDIHASIGVAQIPTFKETQALLEDVCLAYSELHQYRVQVVEAGDTSSHFIFSIELPEGVPKEEFIAGMGGLGVPVKPYFNSLSLLPHLSGVVGDCTVSELIGGRTVALPFHTYMTKREVSLVTAAFFEVCNDFI